MLMPRVVCGARMTHKIKSSLKPSSLQIHASKECVMFPPCLVMQPFSLSCNSGLKWALQDTNITYLRPVKRNRDKSLLSFY